MSDIKQIKSNFYISIAQSNSADRIQKPTTTKHFFPNCTASVFATGITSIYGSKIRSALHGY